jgi:hypothetical protein
MATKRKNWIAYQFAALPIKMLESPAMRVLSLAARRVFERIEIEYAHHGGTDNGRLPVTFKDFERFGLHPNAIAPAIRELASLGFIEVTRKGYGGAAEVRQPSLYRLTYRPAWNANFRVDPHGDVGGTHEHLAIKTVEEAEAIAKAARRGADPRNVERAKAHQKNLKRHPHNSRIFDLGKGGRKAKFSPSQLEGTGSPPENEGLKSRVGWGCPGIRASCF